MPDIEQDLASIQKIYDLIAAFLINYSFQLLGALVALLIGMFIAKKVSKVVLRLCEAKHLDVTLSRFIANVVKVIIVIMVAVICLNMIGISITPLVAAIGAASLGAGLAVQGLLSNYGAGFNIILTRPFVVGDTIQVQGVSGQVRDIHLGHTILVNEDGVTITIPNRHIVGEILHNSDGVTLIEQTVGVAYSSDIGRAIDVVKAAVGGEALVSASPGAQVGILEFADSSVNLQLRCRVPTDRLNEARFAINKRVWDALQANHIEIPFPQRYVTLSKTSDHL